MSESYFKINLTGQERSARELLLKSKLVKSDDLAIMTSEEVENIINENFKAFLIGDEDSRCEDWMLISNKKYEEFCKLVTWICR